MKPADTIFTHTDVRLSLRDRLRVLIRGRLRVKIEVDTEHEPGEVCSRSEVFVPRILVIPQKGGGHEPEQAEPEQP